MQSLGANRMCYEQLENTGWKHDFTCKPISAGIFFGRDPALGYFLSARMFLQRTLSVPRSKQFSESEARRKLRALREQVMSKERNAQFWKLGHFHNDRKGQHWVRKYGPWEWYNVFNLKSRGEDSEEKSSLENLKSTQETKTRVFILLLLWVHLPRYFDS